MLSEDLYLSLSTWLAYLLSPSWEKDHQRFLMLGHMSKVRMYFLWNNYLQILLLHIIILFFLSFTLIVHSSLQVPSSIQIINYKNISSSSILLYWDPPEYPNGKITHYTIYAMELDTNRAFQMTTTENSFLITGRTIFFKTFLFWWKYASFCLEHCRTRAASFQTSLCCAAVDILKNTCMSNLVRWFSLSIFICKEMTSSGYKYHRYMFNTGNFRGAWVA